MKTLAILMALALLLATGAQAQTRGSAPDKRPEIPKPDTTPKLPPPNPFPNPPPPPPQPPKPTPSPFNPGGMPIGR